ncbi:MAG: hypothetical protein FWE83_01195 [Oscillospiraceae bacterium]|nr:hypothetical protein [Oscillospiraceae bacterium]
MSKDIKKKEGSEQNSKKNSEVNSSEEKKRKLKPLHWVIIAVVVLALAGTITYFMWPRTEEVTIEDRGTAMGGRGMILTPDNIEEVRRIMNEPNPDAQYTVSMTTNWVFETSRTPSSNAVVNNREHNSRTVYFDVILVDTGELVYSSPYIPLGGTLENFALDVNLRAGVYDAIIRFHLVDDDNEVVAEVVDTVTLTING